MKSSMSSFFRKDPFPIMLIIAGFYAIWTVVKFLNLLWMYKNNIPHFGDIVNPYDHLDNIILDYFLGVALASLMIAFIDKKFYEKKIQWYIVIPTHLILSFLFGVVEMAGVLIMFYLKGTLGIGVNFYRALKTNVFVYVDMHFLTYFSFLGIILSYYYFKGIKNELTTKLKLKSMLLETKAKALNARLHPHFIFNTLNSVSALIDEDTEKAQELLAKFGGMLRRIISKENTPLIALSEELENLNDYLDILKIRFQEDLEVSFTVEEGVENILVPNFLLQPILENSVIHGFDMKRKQLSISVSIEKSDNLLNIRITNNGRPLKHEIYPAFGPGNGLNLLRQRLKDHFEDNFSFSVKNMEMDSGVENFIRIPIIESQKKEN